MRKKTMKGLVSAGLLMSFASRCAYSWEKPGMNQARLFQDEKECIRHAERSYLWPRKAQGAGHPRSDLPSRSQEIQNIFIKCMEGRGYEAKWDSPGVNLATAPSPREGKTGRR